MEHLQQHPGEALQVWLHQQLLYKHDMVGRIAVRHEGPKFRSCHQSGLWTLEGKFLGEQSISDYYLVPPTVGTTNDPAATETEYVQ